jgi:HEAT repeat protein
MSIQELQHNLNSENSSTREAAVQALLSLKTHEAYGILVYTASNHPEADTRHEAKKAALHLQHILFQNPDQKSRQTGSISEDILKLLSSAEAESRLKGLNQLKSSLKPGYLKLLLKFLHREKNPSLIKEALKLCVAAGGKDAIPHIAPLLRSGQEQIRAAVLEAIAPIKDHESLPLILRFSRDPSQLVAKTALTAASRFEEPELLQALVQMCQKQNQLNQDAAIFVILKLKLKTGVSLLEQLTKSDNEAIRKRADKACGILKQNTATSTKETESKAVATESEETEKEDNPAEPDSPEAERNDTSSSDEVLDEEAEALAKEKEQLFNRIIQSEEKECTNFLQSISEHQYFDLVPKLVQPLKERNSPRILSSLIMIIAQSGDKHYKDILLECLDHKDGRVQANAIEALERLGIQDCAEQVTPFLESNQDRCKTNALIYLHRLGKVDTKKHLESMIHSKKENRQLSAIYAITDLFEPDFVSLLETPMDSPNPKVSQKAIEVLELYILEENPKAIAIAKQWGIYDELQEKQKKALEEKQKIEEGTEEQETKDPDSLEGVLSDLDNLGSEKKDKPSQNASDTNEPNEEEDAASLHGLGKLKKLMGNLFHKS